jgi:hypothetical protein
MLLPASNISLVERTKTVGAYVPDISMWNQGSGSLTTLDSITNTLELTNDAGLLGWGKILKIWVARDRSSLDVV